MARCRIRVLVSLLLCALARGEGAADAQSVLIENVPHVRQKPDFCGEACAAMFLRKLGYDVDQNYVFNQSRLDPVEGRGCYTSDLVVALKRIGFDVGQACWSVKAAQADQELETLWDGLREDLSRGVPSIVCTHFDEGEHSTEHFRLVLGYDAATDEVIYHDPAPAKGAYLRMPKKKFLRLWPLKYDANRWTVVRIALKPVKIEVQKPPRGFTPADFAQHMMKLKKKIPKGFAVVVQPPFVVLGDEPYGTVAEHATRTVKWATDNLKKLYFENDPSTILDIWLLKDRKSYQKYVGELFGDAPDTPFGYFCSRHGALIMNIETGGGTLVHEIVHPFMAANFAGCPSWFNEGLASLYEQCGEKDGVMVGYTNWRLRGLQEAIRDGALDSFKDLCATTTATFYQSGRHNRYAQARYLCYYLQEKGLLVEFYRAFRKNATKDPGGYETLKKVLGTEDMDEFQKTWEKWVLGLTFP